MDTKRGYMVQTRILGWNLSLLQNNTRLFTINSSAWSIYVANMNFAIIAVKFLWLSTILYYLSSACHSKWPTGFWKILWHFKCGLVMALSVTEHGHWGQIVGNKPISIPILTYWQLNHKKQTSMKFQSKWKIKYSRRHFQKFHWPFCSSFIVLRSLAP